MKRTLIATSAVIAAALTSLLSGCSSSEPEAPAKLSGMQEYSSTDELAEDLNSRDIACDATLDSGTRIATQAARCTVNGQETVLSIFSDPAQIKEQLGLNSLFEDAGTDYGWLVGKNWTVNCGSREQCLPFQEALGGRIESNWS